MAHRHEVLGNDVKSRGRHEVMNVGDASRQHQQAFVLTALFYVTIALTSPLILIVALFTRHRRTLHDMLSGTLTLRRADGPEVLLPTGGRA